MQRRLLALVLLGALLFGACGSDKKTKSSAGGTTTTAEADDDSKRDDTDDNTDPTIDLGSGGGKFCDQLREQVTSDALADAAAGAGTAAQALRKTRARPTSPVGAR